MTQSISDIFYFPLCGCPIYAVGGGDEEFGRGTRGMIELHDENAALRIYNRRLRLVVDYALQVFEYQVLFEFRSGSNIKCTQ
jgi:hypothetical protein